MVDMILIRPLNEGLGHLVPIDVGDITGLHSFSSSSTQAGSITRPKPVNLRHCMRIATWNVLSLSHPGYVTAVTREMDRYEVKLAISYWWSIKPKSLSPSVFEIFGIKHIGVTTVSTHTHCVHL